MGRRLLNMIYLCRAGHFIQSLGKVFVETLLPNPPGVWGFVNMNFFNIYTFHAIPSKNPWYLTPSLSSPTLWGWCWKDVNVNLYSTLGSQSLINGTLQWLVHSGSGQALIFLSFFYTEEEPPPTSTLWGAYRSAISCGAVLPSICLQSTHLLTFMHSHTHIWKVEVWWLGIFWWSTHVL